MKGIKVKYTLGSQDRKDVTQELVNKLADEFVELVEELGLDWHGHFELVDLPEDEFE